MNFRLTGCSSGASRPLCGRVAFRLLVAYTMLMAALVLPVSAAAAEYAGRIVGVIDGDTVDVLTSTKDLYRIRLSGIDAPEKGQPFSQVAEQALSALVFSRNVVVIAHKTDRYGRMVGKVVVGGADASMQLLQLGLAWHFKKYEREQPENERVAYASAEEAARSNRLGLWSERAPLAPWDYRAARRGASLR